ncbi:MAG TPA: sigma-70 family RNA polymerase sigma factor [Blastocatellia bacterium]|nr:sigma-70 family RNA polymerase sigma factor [Blastocatellia bacterium]
MTIRASAPQEVTQMLLDWSQGDQQALDRLIPVVYGELRRLASRHLRRERADHTLQTTALIHEAYLKLVEQRNVQWQNRAHFFGIAAQLMRRILVDHARTRHRVKRGGAAMRVPLEEVVVAAEGLNINLVSLDEALTKLAGVDSRQCRTVELRFFGGLSVEETAEVLRVSAATVKNDWSVAKAWLRRELLRGEGRDT